MIDIEKCHEEVTLIKNTDFSFNLIASSVLI